MPNPLFSPAELNEFSNKKALLEKEPNWERRWSQIRAIESSFEILQKRRAQERADEYLNALLILVGTRGATYVNFELAFSDSDSSEILDALKDADTPETRRNLYTLLKALSEIPKTWAMSAFVRFLRGTGKQKDAKYHGAGYFGVSYGWKEDEVSNICRILTDRTPYSKVLMSYADVQEEIDRADPDYEIVDRSDRFAATRVERDKEFLETLCEMLEQRGLAAPATPAEAKPKQPRKVKVFKSGDIIKKSTMRDMPLPAEVRLQIEKLDTASNQWLASTLDVVVTSLNGYYSYAVVPPGSKTAYYTGGCYNSLRKEDLIGAIFLREWDGKVESSEKKTVKLNFNWRRKSSC
ncbi:hypothetical protein C4588_01665 [Candidatus Parcubacteria bacterium]|nr:MAG: hypothetical protein C4588_01665 [Candidatus Parcubacteria bacterium]